MFAVINKSSGKKDAYNYCYNANSVRKISHYRTVTSVHRYQRQIGIQKQRITVHG